MPASTYEPTQPGQRPAPLPFDANVEETRQFYMDALGYEGLTEHEINNVLTLLPRNGYGVFVLIFSDWAGVLGVGIAYEFWCTLHPHGPSVSVYVKSTFSAR